MLTLPAYAKLNLTLEVIGQYSDGYHQIASVMQLIDLCDTLSFQLEGELRLSCNIPQLASPDNLVLKAARLLQEVAHSSQGAFIHLEKVIPWGSGLGGGSSDAATTLRALNELWGLRLPLQDLQNLTLKLGSDVSFFLGDPTALVEGRGERATPLPPFPKFWVVLLRPPLHIPDKTQRMYASLNPSHFTAGQFTQQMVEALERGEKVTPSLCYNAFEQVVFALFPELEEYQQCLFAAGATGVHLVGAGPTLFTLVEDKAQGERICSQLGGEVYLTQTL